MKMESTDINRAGSLILFALAIIALVVSLAEHSPDRSKLYIEIAKVLATIAAALWVVYTWKHERYKEKNALTYEQLKDFYQEYLGPDVIDHRKRAYETWGKHLSLPENICPKRFPKCGESIAELTTSLQKELGVEVRVPTREEVETIGDEKIKSTEFICNRFEQLGKLDECGAIESKVLHTFFYTMLADTFLIVLPYVCYRRQTKPKWAHKFQALVHKHPTLSADPSRS